MKQSIQNIINYEPEIMQEKLKIAKENYYHDTKTVMLERGEYIALAFILVTGLAFVPVLFWGLAFHNFLGLDFNVFVCFSICLAIIFVLAVIFEHFISEKQLDLYNFYVSDILKYHKQVYHNDVLKCYGKPVGDAKFKVTVLSITTGKGDESFGIAGHPAKYSYIFDYDGSNPDGVLTLDAGNSRVFYN